MIALRTIAKSVVDLFYPRLCAGCGDVLYGGERCVCLKCLSSLPRTNYHKKEENETEKRFFGKVRVEHASSFLFFEKKSVVQKLLHGLKYNGKKELGRELGAYFGADLIDSPIGKVDAIVPIPLHPKRKAWRGYNQSEWIAMGLSDTMGKPILADAVRRVVETQTQTKKGVIERWENVKDIFEVTDAQSIRNKHLLVVDDVITTGATVEACVAKLTEVEGVKVSVVSLALAQ